MDAAAKAVAPGSGAGESRRADVPPDIPVVRLAGISKRFGKVAANQDIDLDIRAGRILALLGENGAGKSTLMSILAGRYQPDGGTIFVDGEPRAFGSSKDAIAAGIGMVYQHFMLVPSMTVAQNVLLGQEGRFFLSPRAMEGEVKELAQRYRLKIDPGARVDELSMGERQRVEILRLLKRNSRVLIFDEPTTVLTPLEVSQLFEALLNLSARGKGIVFISHKLEEAMSLADDIAILRRGRIVDRLDPSEVTSKADLASRMVGREVILEADRSPVDSGREVLKISHLSGNGLKDVNLTIKRGEVLAVVGVAGNGQRALVDTVVGFKGPVEGEVRILGRPWKDFFTNPSWKGSMAYIPEDRLGLATCPGLDMVDNVLLTTRQGFTKHMFVEGKRARGVTEELVKSYNVQPPRVETPAGKLSGGNLQKLVLAREFYRMPRLIVAEQPTQGLDVSATEEVWRELLAARQTSGVFLFTGDVSEAEQLADRIAVIFEGRIMDVIETSDQEGLKRIGQLMAGVED